MESTDPIMKEKWLFRTWGFMFLLAEFCYVWKCEGVVVTLFPLHVSALLAIVLL